MFLFIIICFDRLYRGTESQLVEYACTGMIKERNSVIYMGILKCGGMSGPYCFRTLDVSYTFTTVFMSSPQKKMACSLLFWHHILDQSRCSALLSFSMNMTSPSPLLHSLKKLLDSAKLTQAQAARPRSRNENLRPGSPVLDSSQSLFWACLSDFPG